MTHREVSPNAHLAMTARVLMQEWEFRGRLELNSPIPTDVNRATRVGHMRWIGGCKVLTTEQAR